MGGKSHVDHAWRLIYAFAVLAPVMALALVMTALPAQANSTGANVHDYTGGAGNGARASMYGGAALGGSNAFILSSVRVEDQSCCGLYQAGWWLQNSGISTDCKASASYSGVFVERHVAGTSGMYKCNTYPGIGNYGDDYKFTIEHQGSGWEAIRASGGVLDGPYDLSFPGGTVWAVSEKANTINSATMHFGPSGETDWQHYDSSTDTWSTINTASKVNTDGAWTIGGAPTPFDITR